jgi:hypothetical protein
MAGEIAPPAGAAVLGHEEAAETVSEERQWPDASVIFTRYPLNAYHFPGLPNFPHHKQRSDDVIGCGKPDIEQVVREAMAAQG